VLEGRDVRAPSAAASKGEPFARTILDDPRFRNSRCGFIGWFRAVVSHRGPSPFDPLPSPARRGRSEAGYAPPNEIRTDLHYPLHPLNSPRCCNSRKVRRIEVIIGLKLAEACADGVLTRVGFCCPAGWLTSTPCCSTRGPASPSRGGRGLFVCCRGAGSSSTWRAWPARHLIRHCRACESERALLASPPLPPARPPADCTPQSGLIRSACISSLLGVSSDFRAFPRVNV